MINLELEEELDAGFDLAEVANLVVDTVLKKEGCPKECEVEILLTDAQTVHEINKEYRDVDNTTDVLSFPNVDFSEPALFDSEEFNDEYLIDPDNGLLMLGQIVLCKERILSQAEEYGHSVKREYAFLIAHSMLHLLGYDHMEPFEAEIMEAKQKQYLDDIGIVRG